MQLKHIGYFVETSKHRSFNEAAKALYMSQPSLSAAIATLEKELGFQLFTRSKHGITLTTLGQQILPDAEKMLDIQHRWQTLSEGAALLQQPITIYAQDLLCATILVNLETKVQRQLPSVKIVLQPTESLDLDVSLSDHAIALDFFDPQQFSYLQEKSISANWKCVPVASLQALIYFNANHPLAQKEALTRTDLQAFNLATYSFDPKGLFPFIDLFDDFSAQTKLPSREGLLNFLTMSPNYCSVFSSICMYHPYVKDGMISAKSLSDYPMPLVLTAIIPRKEEMIPFYEIILDEICRSNSAFCAFHHLPQ